MVARPLAIVATIVLHPMLRQGAADGPGVRLIPRGPAGEEILSEPRAASTMLAAAASVD